MEAHKSWDVGDDFSDSSHVWCLLLVDFQGRTESDRSFVLSDGELPSPFKGRFIVITYF